MEPELYQQASSESIASKPISENVQWRSSLTKSCSALTILVNPLSLITQPEIVGTKAPLFGQPHRVKVDVNAADQTIVSNSAQYIETVPWPTKNKYLLFYMVFKIKYFLMHIYNIIVKKNYNWYYIYLVLDHSISQRDRFLSKFCGVILRGYFVTPQKRNPRLHRPRRFL